MDRQGIPPVDDRPALGALIEFLRARIAEDEQRARTRMKNAQETQLMLQDPSYLGRSVPGWHDWPDVEADAGRVLAECVAKRRIIDICEKDLRQRGPDAVAGLVDRPTWDVLTALAAVDDNHPDYRQEWKP